MNDFLAELGQMEEAELRLAEARKKFLELMMPQLKQLKTPVSFNFYTNYSPDALVTNIPVSQLILFGGMIVNPVELDSDSDIDIAALFPLVESHGYTFADEFNHLSVGDALRREFMKKYSRKHWGKLPPFEMDIMAFPDPRYANLEYFKTRTIWEAISNKGIKLWEKE